MIVALAFLACDIAVAATKYVRPDGGTPTECTGLTDAAYPGSGTGQACAYKHPFWVLGVNTNCDVSVGRNYSAGDTIIINYDASGYKMGLGADNTAPGASAFPWDCHMLTLLDGVDANNKTKLYGSNYASCSAISSATELYGVEDSDRVLYLNDSDNVDIRCLHITDHDDCRFRSNLNDGDSCTESYPGQNFAEVGLESSASDNVEMHDIWITGMASEGASVDTPSNWTLNNVNLWGNSSINWNFNGTGASGATDAATGTMTFNEGIVAWAGCTLVYPPTSSTYHGLSLYNPKMCGSQSQGVASDGFGTEANGANWVFNDVIYIHNVADGLDLLYCTESGCNIDINRSSFIDNSGNQIKAAGNTVAYNNIVKGNCNFFSGKSYTWEYSGNCATWNSTNQSTCETGHAGCEWSASDSKCNNFSDHCRAGGNALSLAFQSGTTIDFFGNTVYDVQGAEPTSIVGRGSLGGSYTCTSGNVLSYKNDIFLSTASPTLGWMNVDSSCSSATRTVTHSVIDGFLTDPSGTGNVFDNPNLISGAVNGLTLDVYIPNTSSSAYNIADETAAGQPSTDFNGFDRGVAWDAGALEYGSVASGGGSSTTVYVTSGGNRVSIGTGRISF